MRSTTSSLWWRPLCGACALLRAGPLPKGLSRLLVHRKEALDAQLLQRDVLRRPERRNGREEPQPSAGLLEMHGQDGRLGSSERRLRDGCPHVLVSEKPLQESGGF